MTRVVQWLVAVLASMATFVLSLWLAWVIEDHFFRQSIKAPADRWVVATAFAAVISGAVLASFGWWAGRENETPDSEPTSRHSSIQDVRVNGGGSAYVVQDGNQHIHNSSPNQGEIQ